MSAIAIDLSLFSVADAGAGAGAPTPPINFATLFPGAYQVAQTDLGLTYGGTLKPTAGNTSTAAMALTGALATAPVPIWLVLTSGAAANIYYDGLGVTPAMAGVPVAAGVPIVLTGAGAGLSVTPSAGSLVSGNSWKAACSALADQSGNAKHYTQGNAALQPILALGLNGKPGLKFDVTAINYMISSLSVPQSGTTPWVGWIVLRRPSTLAGNGRLAVGGYDEFGIVAGGATSISLTRGGAVGPTGTGLATNTWGLVEYKYSNSAADYIQCGSGPIVTGAGAGNTPVSFQHVFGGGAASADVEVLAVGYSPAAGFSSVAFRAALNSPGGYGLASIAV